MGDIAQTAVQKNAEATGDRSHIRPKIIAILAPKGGVGKTTLSMGLLVSARQAGLRVIGVGMDPQRSLEAWGATREKQRAAPGGNAFLDVPVTTLEVHDWRRLASLVGMDVAILDTAPGHLSDITSVEGIAGVADMIIIPTGSSMQDIFHVKGFSKRLASRKAFFVLNRVNRRTRSYATAQNSLVQAGRLCPVHIPERDALGAEYAKGLALADTGLAGTEFFDALWNFVAGELCMPLLAGGEGEGNHAA